MSQFKRNLAIIIGINNYQHGIPSLRTATNDAEKIAKILQRQHKYKVWGLLDSQATLASCLRLLEEFLPNKIQESDRLIFYFAGHGIALNSDDGPEGFLIPQDARLGDTSTYLPMVRLQRALEKLPCRHFLTILDCCFAGAFRWSSSRKLLAVPEVIHRQHYDRFIEAAAWQVITSASHNQTASDGLALKDNRDTTNNHHSPFAAALIEALQGGADSSPPGKDGKPPGDGVITATELYLYLRDRVEAATQEQGVRQTPGLYPLNKHDRGEYIFFTPGLELNLTPAPPLDESQNPYRGLESFDREHSQLFFGRQALSEKLYRFVREHPLTIVLGASGTGKSSLVKAGLIPYLQQLPTAENRWKILPPMRPGDLPFKELNKILSEYSSSGSSILNLAGKEQKSILSRKIKQLLAADTGAKLLLVIDQTEELTTLCRDRTKRDNFLAMLAEWLQKYPQLRIVLTLRSDFEPQFRNSVFKSSWQKARFIVPAMTREELREAIEKPAAARVMYFEPYSLVEQLIDEVAQMPGALPLLSFALSELYIKYLLKFRAGVRDKRAITQEDYEEIGGVAQSLTQRADREYARLTDRDPAYAETIRCVMLRTIALGGGELARRRVSLSELKYPEPENSRVKEIIRCFSAARLLVEGQDTEGKPYVEPAHDALVRGWQKLLLWKQEEQESIILQRRLTPIAQEWNSLECQERRSGLLAKTEPVMNWVDAKLYAVENLFARTKAVLLKPIVLMPSEKDRLREKPEQFLWSSNPYLNVLRDKLDSSNYWFNQIEAEFLERSIRRKRNISRRSVGSVTIVILFLSLLAIVALSLRQNTLSLNKRLKSNERELANTLERLRGTTAKNQKTEQEFKQASLKLKEAQEELIEALAQNDLSKIERQQENIDKAESELQEVSQEQNQVNKDLDKALEDSNTVLTDVKEANLTESDIEPETEPDPIEPDIEPEAEPETEPDPTESDIEPEAEPEAEANSTESDIEPEAEPDPIEPETEPEAEPETEPNSTESDIEPEAEPNSTEPDIEI